MFRNKLVEEVTHAIRWMQTRSAMPMCDLKGNMFSQCGNSFSHNGVHSQASAQACYSTFVQQNHQNIRHLGSYNYFTGNNLPPQSDGHRYITAEAKYHRYRQRLRSEQEKKIGNNIGTDMGRSENSGIRQSRVARWLRKVNERDRYKGESLVYRHIDARGLVVGRLAAVLSVLLMGKHKPTFTPSAEDGDVVIVTNADKVNFTGKKWDQKIYRHHTGYPGGLREIVAKKQWQKDPVTILQKAVSGMLPKNALRKPRLRKLRLYIGDEHDFHDKTLIPVVMPTLWKDKRRENDSSETMTISKEEFKETYGFDLPDSMYK